MADQIQYSISDDGLGFHARCGAAHIGEITFVRVGIDKMIIDHTGVDDDYRGRDVDRGLVEGVWNLARTQRRRILCMCPVARAVFDRTPAFDDVRLIHMH